MRRVGLIKISLFLSGLFFLCGFVKAGNQKDTGQGPILTFAFDTIEPGYISRKQCLKVKQIRVTSVGENGKLIYYNIKSCRITNWFFLYRKKKQSEYIDSVSDELLDGARNLIARARGGDLIFLSHIEIEGLEKWQINKEASWKVTEPGIRCISLNKNKLYVGQGYNVKILVPGHVQKALNVTIDSGGTISKGEGCSYFCNYGIMPDGTTKTITIYVRSENKDTLYGKKTFRVVTPKPKVDDITIFFGKYNIGAIPLNKVFQVTQVSIKGPKKFHHKVMTYKVNSYDIVIVPKNGHIYTYREHIVGDKLSSAALEQLKMIHPGDIIIIGNIEAQFPLGIVHLNGPTLKIK